MDSGCYKPFVEEDEGGDDSPFECEWVVEFECDNGPGGGIEKLREFSPHEFLHESDSGKFVAPPPLPMHIETFFCPHAPHSTRPPKGRPPRNHGQKLGKMALDKGIIKGTEGADSEGGAVDSVGGAMGMGGGSSPSVGSVGVSAAMDSYGLECPPLLFDFIVNSGVASQEWCGASLLLTMAATNANLSANSPMASGRPAAAKRGMNMRASEVPSETDEMIPLCQSGIAVLCRRVPHAVVRRPLANFFKRHDRTLRASAMIMSGATGSLSDEELFKELFAGHYPHIGAQASEHIGGGGEDEDGGENENEGQRKLPKHKTPTNASQMRQQQRQQQRILQSGLKHEQKFERDNQLQLLFQCLSPSDALTVLLAASLEFSVLLCSSRYSALTAAAEAIRSLLTPLHWVHIYAPVLPRHLLQHLQCPSPFLVGVHAAYAQDAINIISGSRSFTPSAAGSRTADGTRLSLLDPALVIVDLDTGQITHTGQERGAMLSDIVASAALELRLVLNPHLYEADHPLRSFERDEANDADGGRSGGFGRSGSARSLGLAEVCTMDQSNRFPARRIRRVSRQLLQSLLQGFADYCFPVTSGPSALSAIKTESGKWKGNDDEQWVLVLDEEGFIADRRAAAMVQPSGKVRTGTGETQQQQQQRCENISTCMELLVRTQSFSNYVCQHGFYHLGK
jgi:hypothetical protein